MTRYWPCHIISTRGATLAPPPEPWPFSAPSRVCGVNGQRTGAPPTFSQPPGAWGCWRSHLRLWEDMLNLNVPGIVVLEEDVLYRGWHGILDFLAAIPADWDMVYLGGQHLSPPVTAGLPPGVVRGTNINRTHAYIVRNNLRTQAAYWRLCDMSAAPGCRQHIDYVLGSLHAAGLLTAYAPARWFCGQAAGNGRSSTTGAPVAERWWD